jgi:hypothetical protein
MRERKATHLRVVVSATAILLALGVGACGGGGSSTSASAAVGDCVDASNQVVDCSSSGAAKKLVTDQNKPNAIACIQIGANRQTEVKVGGGTFCAENVK